MRPLLAVLALGLTIVLAAPAAAQPPPDDLPSLPAPTLPKAGQKARFKLVVEGEGSASRQVDGSGSNGVCHIDSHTFTSETYEYGRGKGLEVVFSRFRGLRHSPVFLRRVGRRAPGATFNVRGSYRVTAVGEAMRRGPEECVPVTETVGDEPGCNQRIRAAADIAILYENGKLRVEDRGELARLPGCGSNSVETMSQWPPLGWFGFPDTDPEPLPTRRIFGSKSKFLVRLSSGVVRSQTESPIPQFPGQALDEGEHKIIVRFIRLKR